MKEPKSTWRLGTHVEWFWLPVVIGSRSDKLRCVVVEGLTEKLIIGLPGLCHTPMCKYRLYHGGECAYWSL